LKKKTLIIGMVLALVAVLVVPTAALAVEGSTQVTGTLAGVTYTLSVPASVSLTLTRGAETSGNVAPITATTDGTNTLVTIEVKDGSVQGGKMRIGTTSTYLTNIMQIEGGTLSKTNLLNTNLALVTNQSLSSGSYTLSPACKVWQNVAAGDTAGDYSITLTFTATFSGP